MNLSIKNIRKTIFSGEYTLYDIVNGYIHRIKNNKNLNVFIEIFEQQALKQAEIIDKKIQDGKAGKLAGAIVGIKDNILYKNHLATACSGILQNFRSPYSATCVERLINEDAIIIGRLNCGEMALGSSNENSYYGEVSNFFDKTRVAGGSSGGSAVAVAANLCNIALGSDTGGSVRQPAAFNGVVGFKPSYGAISRYGLIAYASSLDQIGIITNTVEDTAYVFDIISGYDPNDMNTYKFKHKKNTCGKAFYFGNLFDKSPQYMQNAIIETIEKASQEGYLIEKIDFPFDKYVVPSYMVITAVEAASNFARYDGKTYGIKQNKSLNYAEAAKQVRTQGFGQLVKSRIITGTYAATYRPELVKKAYSVKKKITKYFEKIFQEYRFGILPVTPSIAFKKQEITDKVQMSLQDMFLVPANLAEIPALSIPYGFHKGLPYSIQIISGYATDKQLLKLTFI